MIKKFNVGVKGVVVADNTCLILQKDSEKESYWDIPGGRIDNVETIYDALERELSEELPSLKEYTIEELVYAHRLTHDIGKDIGLVLLFYKINASHFDVRLSDEHSNYRWVAKSDLPELKKSSVVIDEGIYTVLTKLLA